MKKVLPVSMVCIKTIAASSIFISVVMGAIAQTNTSYNANTTPIGGNFSTAFGVEALNVNSGSGNTANGYWCLSKNTTGSSNTANGYAALYFNSTGSDNTCNGSQALYNNTIGSRNTANGFLALYLNTIGSDNTANGYWALSKNTTGNTNTANGTLALFNNTTGSSNNANGYSSLYSTTTGSFNTGNGYATLYRNTIGSNNTANGYLALYNNTTGSNNNAHGLLAMYNNITGRNNTASGNRALYSSKGNDNVALGDSAGYESLGNGNIYLGKKAGYYETGNNKIYLGNDSNKTILYGDLSTGQLLLGNPQPMGYAFKGTRTLNVLGGILADSVRIVLRSNWADHVFADDYNLTPLKALSRFIETNKHLPGIPTAKEVADDGIELATMTARLLEKIEELTLYVLQQQKQLQVQQRQIKELKQMIVKSK
ncbi:MAG: hypothetical protein H7Z13_19760 [Ferruginibacter sp.]|nr:hypothetical protein [Ferruginibacter sp.]